MSSESLPRWHSPPQLPHCRSFRLGRGFLHRFLGRGAFILAGLLFYTTFFPPHVVRPSNWYGLSSFYPNSPKHMCVNEFASPPPSSEALPSSPPTSPVSDILTPEQIRDIVAPTRGFFARDYSLGLGWNNVRYIIEAALLQAELLNRTLIIPSFVYARACEYNFTVCADHVPMVNRGDAVGSDQWRELPIEQQMAFRIPISLMLDLTHLRARHPVITVSEYLRLHRQDPERESSDGTWQRESYHNHTSVFESNRTKTPSLFVIENHWYEPKDTIRVDYIPQVMKRQHSASENEESSGFWLGDEPMDLSTILWSGMDWDQAINGLRVSGLAPEVDFNDDGAVERIFNADGWKVLHTFSTVAWDLDKTVVHPLKQVMRRSSIRGFKDDYYHVDADVVLLAGEIHSGRKAGSMRFTERSSRARFVNMVLRTVIPLQRVFDLGNVIHDRMRQLNGGRLWMAVHLRRGDFVKEGWVSTSPQTHAQMMKDYMDAGRLVLAGLGNETMAYDIEGVEPGDIEQTTLPPPLPDDRFYVATDERDPDALQVIRNAGGVFLSDLLTNEDRREFGWSLMLTDVRALVEQVVLARSAFFYGNSVSSFSGRVENMRAALGADQRTARLVGF